MQIARMALNTMFFLAAGLWLGGLVLLAIAARLIESALKGRRTEARQLVRRLRGIFQQLELAALLAVWTATLGNLALARFWAHKHPQLSSPAGAICAALLVVPTIASLYSTSYLTRAIKRREAQVGGYTDKSEQIRVRKRIGGLLKQAELLTWTKAVSVAGAIVAAVVAFG